jgi:acyl carrier protein
LDKYLQVLPVIIPGELCIGGIGLSRGYHNNLSLTETKFAATPHLPAKKIYRTGDIARWLLDGNIEFLGRRDHQVKVRGLRIELGEIEAELTKHEKIKEALVISRQDDNGDNFLYVYIVLRAEHVKHGEGAITITGLQEYLRRQLPDYMVPAYFIYLERIPLTPSGKIDHRALPKPEIKMGQSYAAPRDQIEMELVKIWHTILDIKVQLNAIGIDDNFFQLGGHSLKVTSLASRIYKEFNVKIPLNEIFKRPTIRQLSGYIATSAQAKYSAIVPIEKKEYYILSPAQKRLFFLQQMENAGTVYNMLSIWVLTGPLDKNHIEDVFTKLIERHESLRTYFTIIDEKPVQRIHDMVNFEIAYHDLNGNKPGNGEDTIIKNFIRPFDLAKAPLIRVGLIRKSYQEHKLMLDMHHIAVDGTSVRLFINEFIQIYTGSQLSPVKLHYKDFSEWQREWFDSGGIKKQEKHWLDRFKDNTPRLLLLYDYERPVGQYFDFDRVVFKIDPEFTGRIKIFNSQTGITMYMVLLAVYIILLYRYSDQEDIIIGTGTVGRTHPDTEQIIGMFVNMLALRSHPTGYKTCHDFLEEVKDLVLAAFENQDYPFDELVRKLNKKREYGRNPLFDTEFTFQETGTPIIEIPGLKVEPYEYENSLLKFDLSLTAFENDGEIHLILGFSPRLFKRETIELMAGHFIEILNQLEGNKNMKLNEIKITRRLSEASNVFSQSDYTGFEF